MGLAKYTFKLDGKQINPPVNWQGLQVLSTFDNSSVQANITTDEFEFVNEEAKLIRNYITGGLDGTTNGIFEGLCFEILVSNGVDTVQVFEGFTDFSTFEQIHPSRVKLRMKKLNGLNSFDDRSRANSYGYITSLQTFITSDDYVQLPYIVEKLNYESDVALLVFQLFVLTMELRRLILDLKKDVINVVGLAGSVTGLPASIIMAIALVVVDLIFIVILINQIVELLTRVKELLVPALRNHNVMYLRTLLEKASEYLGYTFISPIEELDKVVYLPSKPFNDSPILDGVPNVTDFGYVVSDMFELCIKLFNARVTIIDDEIHLRTENDPFWIQTASYQLPDVLDESVRYNNNEINARTLISFASDLSDDWTIDDFTGTTFEVAVNPKQETDRRKQLLKGLDDVSIPCALGSRKSDLNDVETVINEIVGVQNISAEAQAVIDSLSAGASQFFPDLDLAGLLSISDRFGALKVSKKTHAVPKLIYLDPETGKIPDNHRELWSARVLYEKYHNEKSFVANSFGHQRQIFDEKVVPFGFTDFLKTINNSYFLTKEDKQGKIESIRWNLDGDKAVITYWVEKVFTENLEETFIEA